MEKEIRIDSINITIGKRELQLSMEEAKKLHEALAELFKTRVEYRDYWRWIPHQPVTNPWPYTTWTVTNNASGAPGTSFTSNTIALNADQVREE